MDFCEQESCSGAQLLSCMPSFSKGKLFAVDIVSVTGKLDMFRVI